MKLALVVVALPSQVYYKSDSPGHKIQVVKFCALMVDKTFKIIKLKFSFTPTVFHPPIFTFSIYHSYHYSPGHKIEGVKFCALIVG